MKAHTDTCYWKKEIDPVVNYKTVNCVSSLAGDNLIVTLNESSLVEKEIEYNISIKNYF